MMNKLAQLALVFALCLPAVANAQPDERGPRRGPDDNGPRGQQPEGPEHRGGPPGHDTPLTAETVAEAIDTLRELHGDNVPDWIDRIQQAADNNPEEAARRIARFPRIAELIETRRNHPEEFQLYVQQTQHMRSLMQTHRAMANAIERQDQEAIQALRPQIREHYEALFDIRIQMQRIEIQRMREHLERAEAELQELAENREQLINQRMEQAEQGRHGGPRGEADGEGPRPERRRPDADNDRGDERDGERQPERERE